MYKKVTECRVCGDDKLDKVLDLGNQYVVDFVPQPDEKLLRAPLKMVRCTNCGLVQLGHSVDRNRLYKKFWYRSSINEQMQKALRKIVQKAQTVVLLADGDRVLDIGCNDGTLLGWYPGTIKTVGVDPCGELVEEALKKRRIDVGIKDFFSKEAVEKAGPFKVITAIAMFYDIEDPVKFLTDCKAMLKRDGVLIIQMNYLKGMLEDCVIDNVCHEHLTYYTLHSLKQATDRAGLEMVGAEVNDVNGGSFCIYMTHRDSGLYALSTQNQLDLFLNMMNLMHLEKSMHLDENEIYDMWATKVTDRISSLKHYLEKIVGEGAKIYLYGASTRGTVTMQLLNLMDGMVRGVAERDQKKWNLHMVGGSWPKIYPEDQCRASATHFLVLPWHFKKSIIDREQLFLANGGQLIFPFPRPYVVTKDGEQFVDECVEEARA